MGIFDIYSKRKNRAEGSVPDVYEYDFIPDKLRVQISQIFSEYLGDQDYCRYKNPSAQNLYKDLVKILRKEYGVHTLNSRFHSHIENYADEFHEQILACTDIDKVLDAVELGCKAIDLIARDFSYRRDSEYEKRCDELLEELNGRFKENGVGYEYAERLIVRVDSELIHSEVVKPALMFLRGSMYDGPREEFLNAHSHYRSGKHKEAIVDCLKAFESTMKAICDKRGWTYDKGRATAKDLIAVFFDKGLVPSYWQNNIANLKALLESGVPTGRNKTSGHGQGATPTKVDDSVAEYIMHMTASTILFFAKAEKDLP
ncbi:hypothetical protein G6M11_08440 [Agrobacterium tumefaciens]|nr:hypothetical protein [Agrobacterium tumefaciens]